MKPVQRSETDLKVDDIKRINANHRRSVYDDNEYESSSLSIPNDVKDNTQDLVPVLKNPSFNDDKKNKQLNKLRYTKDGKLKSRFSDVKFHVSESLFEGETMVNTHYFGFYILAWTTVAVIFFDTFIHYHLDHGSILKSPIVKILMRDLWKVALTDLGMYLSLYSSFLIQVATKKGWINWNKTGWIIQTILEFSVLVFYIWFADHQHYPWVGKVFICLHSLVLLMKNHSYAFYNGYFWKILDELETSKRYLSKHKTDNIDENTLKLLNESIEFCEFELNQHSEVQKFPNNINLKNFFEYTMFPTLVYDISYPRTPRIRWRYVFSKICGIFGIITLMIIVAQHHIFPLYFKLISLRELPMLERIKQYPLLFIDLMPPFLLLYLFVWYLIWELILNVIAELSMFGDREFYGDWWNCVSWDEFARLWNIPVHKFLLRHVYHSSISVLRLSKMNATVVTFLISSVVHELVMFVIFGKLRGYLLFLQMCQIPLVWISRSKFMKDKRILGNVVFWIGIATGPSLMCSLYLTF